MIYNSFNTIQHDIELKHVNINVDELCSFNTIQHDIELKQFRKLMI